MNGWKTLKPLYVVPNPHARGGVARSSARVMKHVSALGVTIAACSPDVHLFAGDYRLHDRVARFGWHSNDLQYWTDRVLETVDRLGDINIIVGYYGTSGGFVAAAAAALAELPCIVALRGNDLDRDMFHAGSHSMLAFAVSRATMVTAVSRNMVRKTERWFGVDVQFMPNGVDTELFYPDPKAAHQFQTRHGLEGGRPVAGLLGEFKAKRGLDRLRAWSAALASWQLVLVGHVRDDVQAHIPAQAVRVGYISSVAELRGAYSACDVVLQPSHHDGMPNVVLEAMACGRPVLGSPVGGIPDLIQSGHNGMLCRTPEDWRHALDGLRTRQIGQTWGTQGRAGVMTAAAEAERHVELLVEARSRYTPSNASR
ncbi:MAG: glycosyltransferase family 4 protein [Myxococcota bacterium]